MLHRAGLIDVGKEIERLGKQRAEKRKHLAATQRRPAGLVGLLIILSNDGRVARV